MASLWRSLGVILLIGNICDSSWGIEVRYSGPTVFAFPCNDDPNYLTLEYDVPVENVTSVKWKGTFYVEDSLLAVGLKLDIVFDHPVELTVNPRTLFVTTLDPETKLSHRLTALQPLNRTSRLEFNVQGLDNHFPAVRSMTANGLNLCDNEHMDSNSVLIQGLNNNVVNLEEDRRQICGMRYPIVPETEATENWPWQSSVFYKDRTDSLMICGGTLIAKNTVLTGKNTSFCSIYKVKLLFVK